MTRPSYGRFPDGSNTPTEILASSDHMQKVGIDLDSQTTAAFAALSTAMTGANNDVTLTAKAVGAEGNDISLTLVDPGGVSATLGVVVTGKDIVVNLGRATSAIDTTGDLLKAAIEASEAANALVTIADKAGNDGSGLVTALTKTYLTGGVDTSLVKGRILGRVTASGLYAPYDNTASDGTQVAVGILVDNVDVTGTDQSNLNLRASMYVRGTFYYDRLTGLDAGAITDLNARHVAGANLLIV